MKALLMYRDRDFDPEQPLPSGEPALIQDLELTTLLKAMAGGDEFLFSVAKTALLCSLTDPAAITYRQHILADCLRNPSVVRELYAQAVAAIETQKHAYHFTLRPNPDWTLHQALEALQQFLPALKDLRSLAEQHAADFQSEGLSRFSQMLSAELTDDYLATVGDYLKRLRFRDGLLADVQLGEGNKGKNYTLQRPPPGGRWRNFFTGRSDPSYTYVVPDRDESGFKALSELEGRALNEVANAVAQSADHILNFLQMLRCELAFYLGCLNLYDQLTQKKRPTCFPDPTGDENPELVATGLYDINLSLRVTDEVVGNDVGGAGKSLIMITGANQGGKSTLLRSIGQAQLMMQSGLFVAAERYQGSVCTGLFTHFKREEDATMQSGKFDEELSRMDEIADAVHAGCLVLFNESFAATNEREGSEVAGQIIRALLEAGIRVIFVTHLYDLANRWYRQGLDEALFLRAERLSDGQRTFRLPEGQPLPTSYGKDLYRRVFVEDNVADQPEPAEHAAPVS